MRKKYLLGLDIGTTKVAALVAVATGEGAEVAGFGVARSGGMKKGMVVDMDAVAESVREAVRQAADSSGVELGAAYLGVSGSDVRCEGSFGATGVRGKAIGRRDMDRAIESASAVYVPLDREVLHFMPSDYAVDGQGGIAHPVGMSGVRLEANVNVITASHASVENLARCCEKAGLRVIDRVLGPIASARAVASAEEMRSGVAVMDIGGGTTGIAVFREGALRHASVIPVGGNHITSDIAIGLRVSNAEAERVKRAFSKALAAPDIEGEMAVITLDGAERLTPRRHIAEIVQPRCEEIMELAARDVRRAVLYDSPSCVVFTGGVAAMAGLDRLAEAALGIPARAGSPEFRGLKAEARGPAFSTAVGLLMHGMEEEKGLYDEFMGRVLGRVKTARKYVLNLNALGLGGSGSHAH
jgi:cell division protein FtsA